jgi:hypothetical protein
MKKIIQLLCFVALIEWSMAACKSDDDTGFSQPVITEATVTSGGGEITYGRPATVSIKANGMTNCQATVTIKTGTRTLAEKSFAISGETFDGTETVTPSLFGGMDDNADLSVTVRLVNNDGGSTQYAIPNVKGRLPVFTGVHVVLQTGAPVALTPQTANPNIFESGSLAISGNSFSYKIAEKMNGSTIDYSGIVLGFKDGEVQSVDASGSFITAVQSGANQITGLSFDTHTFALTITTDATRQLPVYMRARGWVVDYFGDAFGDEMIDLYFDYDAQNRLTGLWYDAEKENGQRFEYNQTIDGHTFIMVEYPYEDGVQTLTDENGVPHNGWYYAYEWVVDRIYERRSDNFSKNTYGYLQFDTSKEVLLSNDGSEQYTFDINGNLTKQEDGGDFWEWTYVNDKGIFSECATPDWWFIWSWQFHYFLHNNKILQTETYTEDGEYDEQRYVYTYDNVGYPVSVILTWDDPEPDWDDTYITEIQYRTL